MEDATPGTNVGEYFFIESSSGKILLKKPLTGGVEPFYVVSKYRSKISLN